MKKRSVSIFVIMVMLLTMIPVYSFAAESYLWPVPASKTMSRGYSSSHSGLDITASTGSSVVATKSGTVYYVYSGCKNSNASSSSGKACTSAGCSPNTGNFYTYNGKKICNWGYGNGVVIKHSDGSGYSMYAHMKTVSVTKGATVKQGAVIGTLGSSGNSTGAHLHFELAAKASMSGTYVKPSEGINNNTSKISYIYSTSGSNSGNNGNSGNNNSSTTTASASFSLPTDSTYKSKQSVSNTNAVIVNKVTKTSGTKVTKMGAILMDSSGKQLKKYTENVSNVKASTTSYHSWYDVNSEIGYTLTPGTTYKYQFFGVFDGNTVTGPVYSFTTTGTAPHTHSYTDGPYYDTAHPHNGYYKCSCGAVQYKSGLTKTVDSCTTCNPVTKDPVEEHVHAYTLGPYYDTAHPHNGYYKCSCGEKQYKSGLSKTVDSCTICNPVVETPVEPDKTDKTDKTNEIKLIINVPFIWINNAMSSIDSQGTVPVIRSNRTLLPVRAVIEAMNGTVSWNASSRTVTMQKGSKTLYMQIGNSYAWDSSGKTYALDSAPQIINSRTMLPIRFVVEYFDGSVDWDNSSKTVTINY